MTDGVKEEESKPDGNIKKLQDRIVELEKQLNEAKRFGEERYRTIFNSSLEMIYEHDFQGRFLDANDLALKTLGYDKTEIHEISFADLLETVDLHRAVENISRIVETGTDSGIHEYCLRAKDGKKVWVETAGALLVRDGRPVSLLGLARDFTARKEAEEALRMSEERFREMAEMMPEINYEVDSKGLITYMNRRGLDATGYTQEDLENGIQATDLIEKDQRDRLKENLARSMSGQGQSGNDYTIVRKDGTAFTVITNSTAIVRNGKPVGIRGIAFDITERKTMELRLLQSQKMEAMGRLAGGVAHDMNNVLAGISSLAALIKEAIEPYDTMAQDIEEIQTLAARGGELTRNLLGFARQGKFRKERISLNKMVQQVEKILERTLPKNISMKVEMDPNLNYVEGDPGQLTQALMNLCFNAADAMDSGGTLTIATTNAALDEPDRSVRPTVQPGSYVQIEVADTGEGMDDSTLNSAFEPFFTTKAAGRGTGLGLSMVYGVVSGHGGGVILKSKLGRGTAVSFLIPSYEPEVSEEVTRRTRLSRPTMGSGTILLVDDEKILLDTGKRLLDKLGYNVFLAGDGLSACEIYREHGDEIDLVLLDLGMPVMDGAECFYRLKKINPEVCVLIISGFYDKAETEQLIENGARGFLHKPFTMNHLSRAISRAIGALPSDAPF